MAQLVVCPQSIDCDFCGRPIQAGGPALEQPSADGELWLVLHPTCAQALIDQLQAGLDDLASALGKVVPEMQPAPREPPSVE